MNTKIQITSCLIASLIVKSTKIMVAGDDVRAFIHFEEQILNIMDFPKIFPKAEVHH